MHQIENIYSYFFNGGYHVIEYFGEHEFFYQQKCALYSKNEDALFTKSSQYMQGKKRLLPMLRDKDEPYGET